MEVVPESPCEDAAKNDFGTAGLFGDVVIGLLVAAGVKLGAPNS